MAARGGEGLFLVYRCLRQRDFVLIGRARFFSAVAASRPPRCFLISRVAFGFFRVRGGVVCPNYWLAFCACIVFWRYFLFLSVRWFRLSKLLVGVFYSSFGAGFGLFDCVVVSFGA